MHRFLFFIIILTFLLSCSITKEAVVTSKTINYYIQKTTTDLKNWYHKDVYADSIPGISLEKAYKELLHNKKGTTIIVAVIDSELDIYNADIKDQIWTNTREIPNNNIDDDNNGYVDDIHGWNYVGTTENDTIPYVQFMSTRILEKLGKKYIGIDSTKISPSDKKSFDKYLQAKNVYHKELKIRKDRIAMYQRMIIKYNTAQKTLDSIFKFGYSKQQLDSLLKNESKNSQLYKHADNMSYYLKYNYNPQWLERQIRRTENEINTFFNKNYNGRLTADNPHDINDKVYGNNNVNGTGKIGHALKVASIIGAKRNNNVGIDGITDNVELMSLGVTVSGDEYDKDIALAIRYAVDNGAKIINMSIGRELSMYPQWVEEAIKYAESNDVLIVTSAGNNGYNLDEKTNFPNDSYFQKKEFVSTFIKVGHTKHLVDSSFVDSFSNYGKYEVDIFAPGTQIYTNARLSPTLASGSSYAAPMVTGVAALIRSYYPNLTAAEVKHIIMESGVSYDIMVLKPYADGEKRDPVIVPFSSLSKSGKIVNAYNALLLAEKISKAKKK